MLIIFIKEVREAVGFLPVGLRTRESNYHPEKSLSGRPHPGLGERSSTNRGENHPDTLLVSR